MASSPRGTTRSSQQAPCSAPGQAAADMPGGPADASSIWTHLPDDLFEEVLARLTTPGCSSPIHDQGGKRTVDGGADEQGKPAAACRLVCRQWRRKADQMLHCLAPLEFRPELIVPKFQGLTCLEVCFQEGVPPTPAQLGQLAGLPHLACLSLTNPRAGFVQPPVAGLSRLASCRSLATLRLGLVALVPESGLGLLTGLRRLCLLECMMEDSAGLAAVLGPLTRLATLECRGFNNIDMVHDEGALLLREPEPFKGLGVVTGLTSCDLARSPKLTDATCIQVAALTKLRRLDLTRCPLEGLTVPRSISDAGAGALSALPGLEHLSLCGHGRITDAGLAAIAALSALTHLDLRTQEQVLQENGVVPILVSDRGVAALGALRRLRVFRISHCGIAHAGCAALARLADLRSLELAHCPELSDPAVCRLAQLSRLTALSLAGCDALTSIGVAALAKAMRNLARLDLSAVHSHLTDVGIVGLAPLMGLKVLVLSSCSAVTDAGLRRLLPHAGGLTELDLRDCDRLTDLTLEAVATHCTGLVQLNLEHCPKVTNAGVARLTALTGLRSLRLFGSGATEHAILLLRGIVGLKVVVFKQSWWMEPPA